ncbi:hypothetical protein ES705_32285 [subsurface metagenome]
MPKNKDGVWEPEGGIESYKELPRSLQYGVQAYIELGQIPGDFLCAVIENNLVGAIRRADSGNQVALPKIVGWIYNEAPSQCWGSHDKLVDWVKERELDIPAVREKAKERLPR